MKFIFFLSLLTIVCWAISTKVSAVNEYLNDYPNHCSKGSIEFYSEMRGEDGKYKFIDGDGNVDNSYRSYDDDVNGTIGIRFRKDIGSSCTKEYKQIMHENQKLKQELELLKLCARYQDLELGYQFATVREKCKGVNKKVNVEK